MRILNCGYDDAMRMPTRERKIFLNEFLNEKEQTDQEIDEQNDNVQSSGKGKRTRRVGGEELKQKMQNGEIPEQ